MKTIVFIVATLLASVCQAGDYPNRAIRLLVGFPPGGSTDLAARALGEKLSAALGQAVVVDNKPGASGAIAAEQVARAAPDGYTLFIAATSFATAPAFFPDLHWDPIKDFTPVSLVATVPVVVVVNPSIPARTPQELVAYSKANAGKLNLASPGATTLNRLSAELFKQVAGVDWVTVHYKGGAPAMRDLLGGNAQVMFANISDVLTQVKAGKLRAIAVTTPRRSAMLPEVPTLAESGYPDFSFSTWQAIVGPAGMPPEVVRRLNAEIAKALALPEVKARFLSFGTDAESSTPEALGKFLAAEVAKIGKIARSVGTKTN